jgi:long-chain acyl-CoA synthetase
MEHKPWLKKYDKGVPHTLEPYPQIPLFGFVEQAARDYPDNTALIFKPVAMKGALDRLTGGKIDYRTFNELTDRMAGALAKLGVKKGDRVIILMPNSPQFVIAYFGILKAGGIVVATNPLYSAREMEYQFNDCGAELVLATSNFYARVKEVQPKTKVKQVVVSHIREYMGGFLKTLFPLNKHSVAEHKAELTGNDVWLQDLLAQATPADRPKLDIGPDDCAIFQYTGGTTGISKGAVASHRNLVADTLAIKAWDPSVQQGKETVLVALPLFHVYGMVAAMHYGLAAAATLVLIPNPRDLENVLSAINTYHPTIFPGVPTMYNAVNNYPDLSRFNISSVRACISGSAPLMPETQIKFEKLTGGKLREGYGLSEAPTASHCNPIYGENRVGSIGLPLPDVECKIMSLDDPDKEVGVGEIGELCLKGPIVMQGYWNMPTETNNVLRDGWLYTGDIAKMDEDGYFYIVDRKKDMVIAGGYNIYPTNIEKVIKEHPKVFDVAAAGIPDPHRGETIKVWIVPRPGETLTEQEVIAFCKKELAKFEVPTAVEFRQELPKTMVGKVLRRMLVEEEKKRAQAQK